MKDMMQKYELLSKATSIVESRDEKSINQMTAEFRKGNLE